VVTRRLWSDTEAADWARQMLNFPGLRLLLRVDTEERQAGAVASQETRYFACSLDPGAVTPLALLALVRGHWGVENRLHFIKDRWWDEDRHYLSRPGLAERFALLTGAALAVLRLTKRDPEQPLRARADELCGDVPQAISLLTEKNL
jgi:hypothetical protein